jgi:uncharacterized protein
MLLGAGVCWILAGCAVHRADHFYALSALSAQAGTARTTFARQVSVQVSLPSMVDRAEMVLSSHDGITILEHERWASPLADQFAAILGQDLEARRPDLLIGDRSLQGSSLPLSKIAVEVFRFTARLGGEVSIEARWRITDAATGSVALGRGVFSAAVSAEGYSPLAGALSNCVGQLAAQLLAEMP